MTMPKGKQFDFSANSIFGKFNLFCKRLHKLIEMFNTIQQFKTLEFHNLEGMEDLLKEFDQIIKDFKNKGHDLLD